jgi:hypothetical protein
MTKRRSLSIVALSFCGFVVSSGLLSFTGCTSDTIAPSPDRAGQIESAQKGVDQSAKSKTGRKSGPPIVVKSVKGLIKKGAVD